MHTTGNAFSPRESPAGLRATLQIEQVDGELFTAVTPTAPALARQIATRIQREVTSYAGPATGRRRRLIAVAVTQAVGRFCAALENRPFVGADVPRLFQQLGHGERQDGRSLDSMRAAHLIATQEAWTHLHGLAASGTLPQELFGTLTQALLIYMQQLTDHVTVGYQAGRAHKTEIGIPTARQRLFNRLIDGRSHESIDELAAAADWTIPTQIVVIRVQFGPHGRPVDLLSRLAHVGPETLLRDDLQGLTAIADTHSAARLIHGLLELPGRHRVSKSWPIPVEQARHGSLWARRALRLADQRLIDAQGVVDCAEHRALLLTHADPVLMEHTAAELLAPLDLEKPHSRAVLTETLLLWLQTHASAPKLADLLGTHQQTIRHRMRRLRDLFGENLVDPQQSLALLMTLQQRENETALGTKNTHTHDNRDPL